MDSQYWKWCKQYAFSVQELVRKYPQLADRVKVMEKEEKIPFDTADYLVGVKDLCRLSLNSDESNRIFFTDGEREISNYILYAWLEGGKIQDEILVKFDDLAGKIDEYREGELYDVPEDEIEKILKCVED